MANPPLVSIIVLVRNGHRDILGALETVGSQDYSPMEILVVDGMSTDGTRALVEDYASEEQRFPVRLVDNPGLIQASGWNVGIREAKGQYVLRLDAVHCRFQQSNYIRTCLDKLLELQQDDPAIAATGGRRESVAASSNPWSNAIALAQGSLFGVGNAAYRLGAKAGFADLISSPVYERSVLLQVGLFDESLGRSEDNEFHARMREQGLKLYLLPSALVTYHPRSTLSGFAAQQFHNGWWISATLLRKGKFPFGLRHLVPFLFYLALFSMAALSMAGFYLSRKLFFALAGVYFVSSLLAAFGKVPSMRFWRVLVVFWLMHFCYAVGTMAGFFAGRGGGAATGQLTAPGANPVDS